MSEEQCKKVVEVNRDFWLENDYMRILDSGVPLYVDDSWYNWMSMLNCSKPEIYHHPSIVRLLKSSPVLHKNTASYALGKACQDGDIVRVRELFNEGVAGINDDVYLYGLTPLMIAAMNNQPSVVSLLLTYKELVLDKATNRGCTALHLACGKSFPVIPLLCSDKRCTPVVLNKKDNDGDSPLMRAVMRGNLESLKEMEKLQGTNFRTENKFGEGLLDVARRRIRKEFRKVDHVRVLDYLFNRRKVESLKEQAARAVACLLSCETDVEKLDLPLILLPWVAGFMSTSPIMNIDRSGMTDNDSDFSDEEDGWTSFSSYDEVEDDN